MKTNLTDYRAKRDFATTEEPYGLKKSTGRKKNDELKFVIQYHRARRTHYDFRLEWKGVLLSWAVPKGPSFNPKDKRLAVRVEDHPFDYAEFEGMIPKGEYGGGPVMLWDEGIWTPTESFEEGLKKGSIKLELNGKRLKGGWALVRLGAKNGDKKDYWLLIKEKDGFARKDDGISGFDTSVKSRRTVENIVRDGDATGKKNPFDIVTPQLARLAESPPRDKGWLFEVKYDGYRILAHVENGKARLMSRNGRDLTSHFEGVARALEKHSHGRAFVADGEIIVTDETGKSDFQALQSHLKRKDSRAPVYMIFDLLAENGKDLRNEPLSARKQKLAKLLGDAPDELRLSPHVEGNGRECFEAAARLELEGIVAKRADSTYSGTRNGDWLKIKCYNRQELVLCGYTLTEKKTEGISALLLGYFRDGKLCYAGRAGTGFSRAEARELSNIFAKLGTDKLPFDTPPPIKSSEKTFWLRPKLVAEIQFAEWTDEGVLRQASFKGLRVDKSAKEVVREQSATNDTQKKTVSRVTKKAKPATDGDVSICGVKITNPHRIVFENPRLTKADVAEYYAAAGDRMLKYAGGRIVSVVRCNKGITHGCFFKKHLVFAREGVGVISVKNSDGETSDYFLLKNKTGFVSEAQLGTIEFHVWGSRADSLEKPDLMVFDLDPDEGMPIDQVRRGVKDLKTALDGLGLRSFLKTSGGKGYHVVVPFAPSADWDTFQAFSKKVATLLADKWPNRYTTNMRKAKRKGKIFIDWGRNGRGATSVAPYSLRARPGAQVSMPIAWSELDKVAPDEIDCAAALRRLKKSDPWRGFGTACATINENN